MKAVILAAGKGTRMLPLTLEKPKPLLEVLGRPLIAYTFDALPDVVDEVIVVVNYKGELLADYLGTTYGGRKVSCVRQEVINGTAESLIAARDALGVGPFLCFFADDLYLKPDVELLRAHHYGMLVAEVSDPRPYGVVELAPDGRIVSFEEKPEHPKSNLIDIGVFLLDEKVFSYDAQPHGRTGERYLVDMVMGLAHEHPVYAVAATRWLPIGYPADLARAEALLSKK